MQDNRVCSCIAPGCVGTRAPASKAAMCSCYCYPVAQPCCAASWNLSIVEQTHDCKELTAELLYNHLISFLLQNLFHKQNMQDALETCLCCHMCCT